MRHCPQCGTPHPEAAQRCPACGLEVALVRPREGAPGKASRTIMGLSADDINDTIKMSPSDLPEAIHQTLLHGPRSAGPRPSEVAPPSGAGPSSRTMLGIAPPSVNGADAAKRVAEALSSGSPTSKPQGTLLGVARPGIAPLRPGVAKTPADDDSPEGYEPAPELGATYYRKEDAPPLVLPGGAKGIGAKRYDRHMRVDARPLVEPKAIHGKRGDKGKRPTSRRGVYIMVAGLALAVGAVVFAILWRGADPLSVQVRAGEGGAEVLDVRCPSCPDGTVLSLDTKKATVQAHHAVLDLETPLAIGDTRLTIGIDRPGNGRDESVRVTARVAYRVRPDLTTLEADRPAIQIVVDAMPSSKVTLDGEDIPLRDGRAVRTIDVSKDLTGPSAQSTTLDRRVAFTVTPPDGQEEKGVVAISATILPLVIEAPGPSIVTDQSTFVLAGQTLPGAEIAAAGRALEVAPDGSFARTMNVSSVGATQIEVRAKMQGKAPRTTKISIERVASFDAAETEFASKKPLTYADMVKDLDAAKGKLVVLEGDVAEVRPQAHSTLVMLNVKSGCAAGKTCPVRLEVGSVLATKTDEHLRVFGEAAGTYTNPSPQPGDTATVPVVDVAFARPNGAQKP